MGLFDFLKRHKDEEKVTYGGVTFWAPKPISNEQYQRNRRTEVRRLGRKFDLSTIDEICAIPIPKRKEQSSGGIQSVTGRIEYNLLLRGGEYEKAGKIDLALACFRKANELMPMSPVAYQRDSYMRLPRYLRKLRRFEEARTEEAKLDVLFSSGLVLDYGGDDPQRARSRIDYDWLWEYMPELCPKSFSGYMRMKNANTDKFKRIVADAKKLGKVIQ